MISDNKASIVLQPCPFCGSIDLAIIEIDTASWMVDCQQCRTTGPLAKMATASVALWNQRYPKAGEK